MVCKATKVAEFWMWLLELRMGNCTVKNAVFNHVFDNPIFSLWGVDEASEVDDIVVAESKSLEVMEESIVVGDVIMEKSHSLDNVGYLCRQF